MVSTVQFSGSFPGKSSARKRARREEREGKDKLQTREIENFFAFIVFDVPFSLYFFIFLFGVSDIQLFLY